jgi:hypothetical protein
MRLGPTTTWTAGTAHPDVATYPNHKLLHATPQAPDGWSKWYYVSDRVSEDAYNWEYSQADIGGRKFDSVMRTYLVPRASFSTTSPAVGSAMPNVPASLFAHTSYLLAGREETRTGDEMFDSLYVVDRRNYVKRATLRLVDVDRRLGLRAFEYTTLYYRGETIGGKAVESLFAGTLDGLFGVNATDGTTTTGKQLSDNWFAVSVTSRIPLNGWTSDSNPTIVWREFSTTSLGGFKFDIFDSLWLMNKASQSEATPAPGTVLGTSDWSLATSAPTAYLLFDRKQEWVDAEFDTKYVLERRRYFKRRQSADITYDEATDDHLLVTEDLYYLAEVPSGESLAIEALILAPTNAFWGPSAAGTLKEGRTVSDDWFLVTTRQVVPAAYADGTQPFRDYYTNVNYPWPPVLEDIEIMDWVLKEGATRNFPRPVWKRYGYNGPTSVRIREYWKPAKWDLSADLPEVMIESPIHYPSPIQPISIPACLHPTITCRSDTGTNDPDFGVNSGSTRVFLATNYTDWPSSLYIEKSQQPFRGGWRKRTVQAFSPDEYPVVVPA